MVIDALNIINGWPTLLSELDEKNIVEAMAKFKIDKAGVLSSKCIFFDAHTGNEMAVKACGSFPDKLLALGLIDPRVSIAEEIAYCVENGIKALTLYPETQGWSLDSLLAKKLFSELNNAFNMPLMIEAKSCGNIKYLYDLLSDFSAPVILVDVSLKNLSEALELVENAPNIHLTTRTLCGADTIEMLSKRIGADRLIFSSSYPVNSFSAAFLATRYAKIPQGDLNAILGDNIAKIFGV